MNEPVRVGLVFPRIGQQLFVNVPRHFAAKLDTPCAGLQTQGVVYLNLGYYPPTDVYEHQARTQ